MRPNAKGEASPVRLRRPFFTVGMTYGGCLLLAASVGFHRALIGAAVAALFFFAALAVRRFRHNEIILAALLTAVAAFCVFSAREYLIVRPLQRHDGEKTPLTLWLEKNEGGSEGALAYCARVTEGSLPPDTRVLVWVKKAENAPALYDEIAGDMTLFASDRYRAGGIYLTAAATGCDVKTAGRLPWYDSLEKMRDSFLARADGYVAGERGALVRAICFGDKSRLSSGAKEDFAAVGLSHLTVVSGFHLTVITMGLFALMIRLGLKRKWAALLAWPVPLLFAALTGFAYSALRAGAMCLILMGGFLLRRRADGKNSLGCAVLAILLWDPEAVYDLGFLLSVGATLGILLTMEHVASKGGLWGKMGAVLVMTLSATAATMPLTAFYFGSLPLLSPLTNLVGEPLAAWTVVTGCLGALLAGIPQLDFLIKPLFLAAGGASALLLRIKDLVASLGAVLTLDRPYLLVWACALPFLLAAGYWLRGRRGLRVAGVMLVIALLAGKLTDMWGMRGVTAVTCCEAEEGSMVLLTRDGRHALILTGAPRTEEVRRLLERQQADRVDLLLCGKETPAIPGVENRLTEGTARFWNDCTAKSSAGWTYITLGDTGILICPRYAEGGEPPPAWRQATVTVFDRRPPESAGSLATLQGVVCCGREELAEIAGAIPWGKYPLAVTKGETVQMYTRGLGDCELKETGYALE